MSGTSGVHSLRSRRLWLPLSGSSSSVSACLWGQVELHSQPVLSVLSSGAPSLHHTFIQSVSPQSLKRLCYKPGATLDTGFSFPDPKPQLETSEVPSSFNLVGPTWALPSALQPTSTHPASPHPITYFRSLAPLASGFSSLHATTACPAEHSSPPCRLLWTHL